MTLTSKTEVDIYRSVVESFFDAFILLDVHKKTNLEVILVPAS